MKQPYYDSGDYPLLETPYIETSAKRVLNSFFGFHVGIDENVNVCLSSYYNKNMKRVEPRLPNMEESGMIHHKNHEMYLRYTDNLSCSIKSVKHRRGMTMARDVMALSLDELLEEYGDTT